MPEPRRRSLGRGLDSFLLLILALGIGWLSLVGVRQQARFVDLHRTAISLERGGSVRDAVFLRRRNDVEAVLERGDCDISTVRAALTVALTDAGQRNPAADYDGWADTLERSRRMAAHALACSPHDGNFRARLAAVERLVAANPPRLAALQASSERLAPAEFDVLRARFAVWGSLADWPSGEAAAALGSDLAVILANAHLSDIRSMLAAASPVLMRQADAVAARLPAERREDLKRVAIGTEPAARQPRRPSSFDMLDSPRRQEGD